MLREDAAKAREDANAGRAEAARMRNEAGYERERCQRLQEQLSDSLKQVDSLTQSNTKYQVWSQASGIQHPIVLRFARNCPLRKCHALAAFHALIDSNESRGGCESARIARATAGSWGSLLQQQRMTHAALCRCW